jgi:hypothetical protein
MSRPAAEAARLARRLPPALAARHPRTRMIHAVKTYGEPGLFAAIYRVTKEER